MAGQEKRLFRFGIITDVQHADIEDGFSFHGVPRFYRESLRSLHRSVGAWNAMGGVDLVLHLGDIIDGKNKLAGTEREAMEAVLIAFSQLDCPVYHAIGNHELYNFARPQILAALGIDQLTCKPDVGYYAFSPHPGWRVVVLDGFDLAVIGWPGGHPHEQQARAILEANNPNMVKESAAGMDGLHRRFVAYGGGVSNTQLLWLQKQLQVAESENERVLLCCHMLLHPIPGASPSCLLWNYDDVLSLLRASGNVVATFAGHAHKWAYAQDDAGVHHMVLPSPLEAQPGTDAFGTVDVHESALVLQGAGNVPNAVLPLKSRPQQQLYHPRVPLAVRPTQSGTALQPALRF